MPFALWALDKDLSEYSYLTVQLVDLSTIALEHWVAHTLGRKGASHRPTCIQRCLRRAMGEFSRGDCCT